MGDYRKVRARRGRTIINKDNVKTLQFLDLMNTITASNLDKSERFMLSKFIENSGVTKKDVEKYINIFPAKATRNLIESGAIYELT